jgi:DNA-directed RNA polymerase subunit beta
MANPGFKEPALPAGMRAFDDTENARKAIYDGVVDELQKKFPLSDGLHRLELAKLRYSGPQTFTQQAQKKAIMSNRNLNTPLTGTWRLVDEETGKVLDEREDVVMHVPYYTNRGTVINRGNEYSIVNQARLKPGVYTRTKQSGEHEAHFNVKPGTGRTFRMWMEPATGIFRVNVGQANIPAYPLLKIMGISDEAMQKAWGSDVYDANLNKVDKQALQKLYKRFSGSAFDPSASPEEMQQFLQESIPKSVVDPGVVTKTMGLAQTENITPELMLRSTQKLLNISRGEEEEDDRESPQFSDFYSVEDFVKERIEKDAGRTARQLLWKIRRDKNLKRVGRGALNPYIQSLILGSGLASPLEETNPFQILDQQTRVIKLGEGGIGSAEMVIDEARDVNPNQLGFIDLIAGPESGKIGVDVRTAFRTFKGKDKQIYGEFLNPNGKRVYKNPGEVADLTLGFPDQDPNSREVHALRRGKMVRVKPREVDLWVPSQEHMFGPALNMVPMVTSYMPSRAFYSAKYWSQFLPMVKGETPLVQSSMPGSDRSFFEYYGRKVAAINSQVDGVVSRVGKNGITIVDENGKKHFVETVQDFPYNRMTAISYKPRVKTGDVVKPGDLLASSNFTDKNGSLAMGRNLRTAIVPYRGHSFEDAVVMSESAAEKMATERLYGVDKESRNGVQISRNRFISAFPSKYKKEQIEKMDDHGVVKPGMMLQKGDPIVLAVGPKLLSSADAQLGKLHKALRNAFRDESVEWQHASPGLVVDVGRTTTGVKVNVKSTSPVQIGDKFSNLSASKGIVAKIVPDDEMPKNNKTGEPYELLLNPMVVLSRVAPNQLLEMQLGKIAAKTGKPYVLPSEAPEEGWNQFVKNELAKHGLNEREEVYDPQTGHTIKPLGEGVMYLSAFHHLAEKKLCVSEDTEILTRDGWKLPADITFEDEICTLNPDTGEEEYYPYDVKYIYDVDNDYLYNVTSDERDELVTEDHRLFIDGRLVPVSEL